MKKKCYNCGKEHAREGKVFCEECEDKPRPTSDNVLVIWDKI